MQQRRDALSFAFKIAAVAAFFCSFFVAFSVEMYGVRSRALLRALAVRVSVQNVVLLLGFCLLWALLCLLFGLYRPVLRRQLLPEVARVAGATLTGVCILAAGGKLFSLEALGGPFLATFFAFTVSLLLLARRVLSSWLSAVWCRPGNVRHVLVVGTGERASAFARALQEQRAFGYRCAGLVRDRSEQQAGGSECAVPVVTDLQGLPEYLRRAVVDEVVIFLPVVSHYREVCRIIRLCEDHGLVARVFPPSFPGRTSLPEVEEMGGESVLTVRGGNARGIQLLLKRFMDVTLSFVGLLVLWPVLCAAAVAIKTTSPGPVFFVQDRIGLNKRRFKIYKFRTMSKDAERRQETLLELNEASGPVFKISRDPRVTAVGRLLRRLSIDELPQLFNVLKGDMSLVGPRPLPVRDYEGFTEQWHRRRFSVRPGLTCLWQVNGRDQADFDHWMALDMEYIDSWSLWLDLKLIAKTIPAVFRMTGAV